MKHVLSVAALWLVVGAGCGSDGLDLGNNGNGGTAGAAGSGSVTPVGNGQCTSETVSTTDGTSACEPPAMAGEHCSRSGVTTLNGCLTEANCSQGQTCDKSANTRDIENNATGVCRAPRTQSCSPVAGGGGAGGTGGTPGGGGSGDGNSGLDCLTGVGEATAECGAFTDCMTKSCNAQLTKAFGAGYASGQTGGDCQAYYQCVQQNNCVDEGDACAAQASSTCQSDLKAIGACLQASCASQQEACDESLTTEGPGGAGGGPPATQYCKDLVPCCQQISDDFERNECASRAGSNIEAVCESALLEYKAKNACVVD